jgi:YEATS domain-containing protein 4
LRPLDVDNHPFEVSETGWGEFEIQIKIIFVQDSGEKAITFYHHLKLHPWNLTGEPEIPPYEEALKAGPVHSWQYDEIVFNDPYNTFLNTLKEHPPTPLPKVRTKPVPFHTSNPASLEASKGGVPEFTKLMEDDEGARLRIATQTVKEEQKKWEETLREKEKELEQLQKIIADS